MTSTAPPATDTLSGYTKAVVSILAAIIAAVAAAITDNTVTALELAVILIAAITAVNVYLVPNLPEGRLRRHAKSLVAFFGAALALLVTTLGTGGWSDVTASEWLLVILAGLGGVGVTVLPNTQGVKIRATGPTPVVITNEALDPATIAQAVREAGHGGRDLR